MDAQIGVVMTKLNSNPTVASNTVVVFTSDHGEYGGSHGLHSKGGGVYDEAMRVPLCVIVPGWPGQGQRYQMCSSVDFFGFICDLGSGGAGTWSTLYPNLQKRESIYSFLNSATAAESKRIIQINGGPLPYILHTTDENFANPLNPSETYQSAAGVGQKARNHVVSIRTKTDIQNHPFTGAKYAMYSTWGDCTALPDATGFDFEYYDYTYLFNRAETGNNHPSRSTNTNANSLAQLSSLVAAMGNYTTNVGFIQTDLNATLIGNGMDGVTPLTTTLATATENYLKSIDSAC